MTERRLPTEAEVKSWLTDRRNWGRWGPDDQRGAINLITPAKRVAATRLVRTGRSVSLSRPFPKEPGLNNYFPAQHYMRTLPRGRGGFAADYYGIFYHGVASTHIDALCHVSHQGRLHGGIDAEAAQRAGVPFVGVLSGTTTAAEFAPFAPVAVLPEADEVDDVKIDPAEIRVDVFRASGAGGQHVNKTESAVRITHLPTGIVVECQDDRSQHKNRERALRILAARIKDQQLRAQQAKEASTRKSLIGSGDRSERIRTYNFPQGRVTDHRINLTLYKIDQILDGDLDELTAALTAEHQAELLAALADGH